LDDNSQLKLEVGMNPIVAFVVVMAVWTVSEFVARKTKSLLSSLFVASLIFLVGFLSGIFPEDLLASSSLLALSGAPSSASSSCTWAPSSASTTSRSQWKTLVVGHHPPSSASALPSCGSRA
jgi:hypothetical protein